MRPESPFSADYDIGNITDSQSSEPEQDSTRADKKIDDFIKTEDYKPSKPRRIIIRARVIPL